MATSITILSEKKKLWYNPSNRMYFDSRHCINISPDIFTDIQKKNTHKNPPRNIDSHRQNIDVHTENASNLTDLTNRNKFTQVRRTEVRSVKQDHRTKTCPDVNSLQTSQTTHPATENVWPMGQEVSSTDRERTPGLGITRQFQTQIKLSVVIK